MWPRFIFVPVSLVFNAGTFSASGREALIEIRTRIPVGDCTRVMLFYDDYEYDDTVTAEQIEHIHFGLADEDVKLVSRALIRARCRGNLVIDFNSARLLEAHAQGAVTLPVGKHSRLSTPMLRAGLTEFALANMSPFEWCSHENFSRLLLKS